MKITVHCSAPNSLLSAIYVNIDGEGGVSSWKYTEKKNFYFESPQYKKKAYVHPKADAANKTLTFDVRAPKDEELDDDIAAIHLGHFVAMLMTHFRPLFKHLVVE